MKRLKRTQKDGVTVVSFRSDLTQHDFLQMREYFASNLFGEKKPKVVVDCEGMAELPSIAFGLLCSLSRDATRAGGNFAVIHVADPIHEIIKRIHVDQQVNIFSTLSEAVDSMT